MRFLNALKLISEAVQEVHNWKAELTGRIIPGIVLKFKLDQDNVKIAIQYHNLSWQLTTQPTLVELSL